MFRPILTAAGIAAASFTLGAVPVSAQPALTHQVNVTITNTGCKLQSNSVSRANTTILFHVVNLSARPAGIVVYSLKSRFATPKVGASDLQVKFRGAGHYPYTCVAGNYKHPSPVAKGVFTIRQK